MVSARQSEIGHRGLAICNPVSSATLDAVVDGVPIRGDDQALDIGCGKGELLLRLCARYGASGVGIDLSGDRIGEAQAKARALGLEGRARFVCRDARAMDGHPRPVAVAACVGSTHALGGLAPTLEKLVRWTAPGGFVVIGEGFWVQEPGREYLDAIAAGADELGPDGWVEREAARAGLGLVDRWTSTRADWDKYEDTVLSNIVAHAGQAPQDEEAQRMVAQQRTFHEAQLRWGRSTMGFAVFSFRKPG